MRAIILIMMACAVAACANDAAEQEATRQRFTNTLNSRLNLSETQLVRTMGRIPDSNYQPTPTTRMLLWKLEVPYTVPRRSPEYVAIGTSIVPVGGRAAVEKMAYCNVEWLIENGVSRSYRTYGDGCP